MKRAQVLTPWIGDGSDGNAYHPQLPTDHAVLRWVDVTAQPTENLQPDPNLFVVEIVGEDAVLAAIDADSTYLVLWDEDIADA